MAICLSARLVIPITLPLRTRSTTNYLPNLPTVAKDLICKLLIVDPVKRLDVEGIIAHEWTVSISSVIQLVPRYVYRYVYRSIRLTEYNISLQYLAT